MDCFAMLQGQYQDLYDETIHEPFYYYRKGTSHLAAELK
jgi:hypothetical protein